LRSSIRKHCGVGTCGRRQHGTERAQRAVSAVRAWAEHAASSVLPALQLGQLLFSQVSTADTSSCNCRQQSQLRTPAQTNRSTNTRAAHLLLHRACSVGP
jgi:hypothetical protein